MRANRPSVSVIVAILDEARHFESAVGSIIAQRYEGEMEFVFVDNGSTDGTRERLARLADQDARVRVVDNPRRGIPISLNRGLAAARHELIARMDAHSEYPPDYVSCGVEILQSGRADWVAGPAYARGAGGWSTWVAAALSTRLGVGGADFRTSQEEIYTDTAFGGVAATATLRELGGWDERWVVNEDAELATRAREAGVRILLAPAMAAWYLPRSHPGALARQYWRYGLWRARTSVEHPASMRPSHLLPPLVTIVLAAAVVSPLAPRGWSGAVLRAARIPAALYGLLVLGESVRTSRRNPGAMARLAVIYPLMHVCWGAGNIRGFLRFGSPLPAVRAVAATLAARLAGRSDG